MGSLLLSLEKIFPSFPFSPRNAWYSDYLLLHSHSLYRHATLLLSCGAFTWYKERLSSRLQSVTLNLGHIALVPAFCLPMLFWSRFSVDLSKFEANFEEREKEVKQSMSTLFLLLTQVLMSQVMGSCPGEGHWVMLALEMSLPIWQKVTLEVKKKSTLFECQCIQHESTNWDTQEPIKWWAPGTLYFYVSNWRRDGHFTWPSEPREGLACCSAKGVPSFLGE